MAFIITPPETPAIPIFASDDLFPINRVYCVGRNYADHAIEMGHDPDARLEPTQRAETTAYTALIEEQLQVDAEGRAGGGENV